MQISRFNQPEGFGPRYAIHNVAAAQMELHDAGPFGLDHGERYSEAQEALDACAALVRQCEEYARAEGHDTSPGSADEIAFRVVELTYQGTPDEGRWVPARFVDVAVA